MSHNMLNTSHCLPLKWLLQLIFKASCATWCRFTCGWVSASLRVMYAVTASGWPLRHSFSISYAASVMSLFLLQNIVSTLYSFTPNFNASIRMSDILDSLQATLYKWSCVNLEPFVTNKIKHINNFSKTVMHSWEMKYICYEQLIRKEHLCFYTSLSFCSRGGSLSGRGLCPGRISIIGGGGGGSQSKGTSVRGVSVREIPLYGKERTVRILLECVLVINWFQNVDWYRTVRIC